MKVYHERRGVGRSILLVCFICLVSYGGMLSRSVTLNPPEVVLKRGMSQQFFALLEEEMGQVSQDINWRVDLAQGMTSIDNTGLLVIGADETSASLIVTATTRQDVSRFGMAIVHVIP